MTMVELKEDGRETSRVMPVADRRRADTVIVGAGIAGLAAGVVLARDGLDVVCIDPDPSPAWRVGESLDWSAHPLVERLGMSIENLVAAGLATYKREVRAHTTDGQFLAGRPYDWLLRWPFRFEADAIHLERGRFDRALYEAALEEGVSVVSDAVTGVEMSGERVARCTTRSGHVYSADWFIDASGQARVIARAAGVATVNWSERRLSIWSHCDAPIEFEGTRLHLDGSSEHLDWAWEIPVAPERLSVGVVMAADEFRERRRGGVSPEDVLRNTLARFPKCRGLASARWDDVRVRSYRGFVSDRACGPNWLLTGEAMCFVDPLTSIGVTSAMRHGCEAAETIIEAAAHPERTVGCMERYQRRTQGMARLYNEGVERLLYDARVRRAIGMRWAVRAYVTMGYTTTSLYGKLPALTTGGTTVLSGVLGMFHLWIRMWTGLARVVGARNHWTLRAWQSPQDLSSADRAGTQ
jgi:flavin-dependent dehydrogenase